MNDPFIKAGRGGYRDFITKANAYGKPGAFVDAAMREARDLSGYKPPVAPQPPRGSIMFPGAPSPGQIMPPGGPYRQFPGAPSGSPMGAVNQYKPALDQYATTGVLPKGWTRFPPRAGMVYPAVMPKRGHIFIYAPDGSRHEVPAMQAGQGVL